MGLGPELPADLRSQIVSISDASREVLHSLDEIVWAVNPRNDSLPHLIDMVVHFPTKTRWNRTLRLVYSSPIG